jgi:peroxiredoxin
MMFTGVLSAQQDDRGYITKTGDFAPDFEATGANGVKVKLSDLKGKVVMLQFTASWCSVCRKEMPHIEADIWQKYRDNRDFALIALARDEGEDKIRILRDKTKVTYNILPDKGGEIFCKYAAKDSGVTRNVIIDRSGKIIFQTRLFNPEEFDAMKKVIDSELKKTK